MKRLLLSGVAVLCGLLVHAQLLTWSPAFPKENDASQNLVITVDASKGNTGLLNFTGDVYVHIGAITTTSNGQWSHVPFTWATTPAAAKAVSIGGNKWQYTISGSLRTFFGITNSAEIIQKIGILFRSGDGGRVQRNANGSDMFVPIYDNSLAVRFTSPFAQPTFTPIAEPITQNIGESLSLTAVANAPATLKLYLNGTVVQTASNATTISASPTLTLAGHNEIVAEADNGTSVKKDTLRFFLSTVAALPAGLRDGINYESNNTAVTLVLRAPGKTRVSVIGEFPGSNWTDQPQYRMNKTADGKYWWLRITGLTAGTEYAYQYVVDSTLKIADPYTEKILDPYPGDNNQSNDQNISSATYPNLRAYPAGQTGIVSLLQTNATPYNWAVNNFTRPDKRGLVIYELLVRDLVAAHDWKTVRDSLDYFKKLGVNALEIMPFNEFEGNDSWGYNPDFYFAPDKYYGPKNTLKEFIDSCHKKGIAVIMDIALNHSFGLSPMVQLYWDGSRPTASNPWFNPAAKHAFNVGFDMNHESLDTRYFVSRVVEHWLQEYKIDGFRFDLSKGFTQVQTCDNNGDNCNVGAWGNYDASRVAIWKRYYDSVQLKSANAYVILEHFADNSEEKELSDYGMMLWGNMNGAYQQAAKGVSGWDFSGGIYTDRGWSKPHLITFQESHDEERIVYNTVKDGNSGPGYNTRDLNTALKRMELNAAFLFTIPGPKMLWQFGELGYDYSINYCPNGTISNDCRLARKPIRWDYLAQAPRKSLFDVHSKLISLRFTNAYKDAFMTGTIERSLSGAFKWIKVSSGDTSKMVVVGNFDVNSQSGTVTFPSAGTWYDYLNNTTFTATGTAQSMTLVPGEYHVYLNRNLNGVSVTPVTNVPWNGSTLEASAFPNPASNQYTVALNLPQSGTVTIGLYNTLGQYTATVYNSFLAKGTHKLSLHNTAAKGNYYLKVQTKSATATIPITIQ